MLEERQVMLKRVTMELMMLFWEVERGASEHRTADCTGCNQPQDQRNRLVDMLEKIQCGRVVFRDATGATCNSSILQAQAGLYNPAWGQE